MALVSRYDRAEDTPRTCFVELEKGIADERGHQSDVEIGKFSIGGRHMRM
jgi:hypothetical protein